MNASLSADFAEVFEAYLAEFDKRNIRIRDQLRPPATSAKIEAFEAAVGASLPEDVRALYRIANGQESTIGGVVFDEAGSPTIEYPVDLAEDEFVGNLFGSYEFLSLDEAQSEWTATSTNWDASEMSLDDGAMTEVRAGDPIMAYYYHPAWIPIAKDGGGNLLSIDMQPTEGGTVGQIIAIGPDESEYRRVGNSLTELFQAAAARGLEPNEGDEQRYYFDIKG